MRARWAQMNLPRSTLMESSFPDSYCRRMSSSSDTVPFLCCRTPPCLPRDRAALESILLKSHQLCEVRFAGDDGFDRRPGAREQDVDARPVAAQAAGAVDDDPDGRGPLLPPRTVRAVVVRDGHEVAQPQLV